MTIGLRLLLYTGIAVALAVFFRQTLSGPANTFAEVSNLVLWLTYCGATPFLDRKAEKERDDAYLYYLGISSLRMLLYMGSMGLALFSSTALRNRLMLLVLTVGFLCYTVVEVTALIRKLRQIFKSHP